jgi:hypothetical protein
MSVHSSGSLSAIDFIIETICNLALQLLFYVNTVDSIQIQTLVLFLKAHFSTSTSD